MGIEHATRALGHDKPEGLWWARDQFLNLSTQLGNQIRGVMNSNRGVYLPLGNRHPSSSASCGIAGTGWREQRIEFCTQPTCYRTFCTLRSAPSSMRQGAIPSPSFIPVICVLGELDTNDVIAWQISPEVGGGRGPNFSGMVTPVHGLRLR